MKNQFKMIRILFLPITIFLIGCGTAPLSMKVHDSDAFSTSKSLLISDFSTEGATINYEGNADSLGHVLAVLLQQELQKKAGQLTVTLEDDESDNADLIIEGGFTKIDEGDAAARVMVGQEGVLIQLDGVIKNSDGKVVANFNANKESAGGPLGMGGLLAGDSDVIIENLMEEIAEELSDFIIAQM
jgi:hypothetical protein